MRLSKAKREVVSAVRKDTIVGAAGSVLEEHGVDGMTMDRVAAVAGLAKGSLYNYFEDKDDLLRFVYARLIEPFLLSIEEIAHGELAAPEKLERIVGATLQCSDRHKAVIRLLAEAVHQRHELRKHTRPRLMRLVTSIFERGIVEGSFRPHNSAHAARMFLGCLAELCEMQVEGASSEERSDYVRTLISTLLKGVSVGCEKRNGHD